MSMSMGTEFNDFFFIDYSGSQRRQYEAFVRKKHTLQRSNKKYVSRRKTNLIAVALINSLFCQKRILFCDKMRTFYMPAPFLFPYISLVQFLTKSDRPVTRNVQEECILVEGKLNLQHSFKSCMTTAAFSFQRSLQATLSNSLATTLKSGNNTT